MKKKIKDLELWDIYYFNRRKTVCVGVWGGLQYYANLEIKDWVISHWEDDSEKKVTVIGKMKPEMN